MDEQLSALDLLGFSGPGWGWQLLKGALATVEISAGAFAVSMLIGISVALMKGTRWPAARAVANAYTTMCRAIPELLLIIVFFYAGTAGLERLVVEAGLLDEFEVSGFVAAVVVLGIVQGAYASEILRGAMGAVPAGPIEAGRAFGMTRGQIFRRVVFPLMLPLALAGLGNTWMVLLKESALVSVVGYLELLKTASQAAASTKMYFFFYMTAGAIYLAITLVSGYGFRLLERRARRGTVTI